MRRRSALLLASIALLAVACAGPEGPARAELGDLPIGKALEDLWRAHGGLEAWEGRQHVRMRVSVSGDAPAPGFPAATVQFRLRDWTLMEIGAGTAKEILFLEDEPGAAREEQVLDYHLRTARMLFQLPFSLSLPGWEFRRDVIPAKEEPLAFWAVPVGIPSPHSAYYLMPDRGTGLLGSVYFQASHPGYEGKVFVAEYRHYVRVDGMLVPTEIAHGLVHDPGGPAPRDLRPLDPFEPERAVFDPARLDGGAEPQVVFPLHWVLRIDEVSFE